ncbi:MAG: 4a-hydroxytetrahydrobiopterin dehydratase [Chlamydiae bacterium]|nr:4a-hydroxytetrahydrobiopterin dehydratase [Chlamydiota bacterium]MBI3276640.1 4a-hydroxytetrahydrobiopterin dehydratase [Chlamydiota bacterium]
MSDTQKLTQKKCQPCSGQTPLLSPEQVRIYFSQLSGWEMTSDGKGLIKNLKAKDFQTVLTLVNKMGACAEEENHHPNLYIHHYRNLRIELSTHAIDGLSENDFILAAKIDKIIASI